ncbi:MAG: purine-nucleoside phosphorylase [Clostridia bacterium]|nr:purine-nucleoside phosphorylase [Clostridia bacterium]
MEMSKYSEAVEYIQARIGGDIPKTAVILGSGLGVMADEIVEKVVIPYREIPHFPLSTVAGHAGELIIGKLNFAPIIAMNGRFHYYEGYDFEQITFPIRVFALLGVENIILTNAAGGINFDYAPGDFMIIRDHINFSGVSPLRGKNLDEFGPRFPDMTNLYDNELSTRIRDLALASKININEGVYAYLQGPNYETPAEIKALRVLGADAVGMSTVPEAIVARHSGIKVAGISCITNMAAGILDKPLNHEEVKETAELVREQFKELIKNLVIDLYTAK